MIVHVDLDAFYALVEELAYRPELVGKPVIVAGAAERRGVVSAASYVARRYGVHSAMATATARRLCPHGVYLPPRIGHYAEVSRQIRDIFERFTPLVEPLSLDEAFLDVTGSEHLFGSAEEIGWQIKRAIRDELRLTALFCVAPNKSIAKIASDLKKPDALVVVEPGEVQEVPRPIASGSDFGGGKAQQPGFPTAGHPHRRPAPAVAAERAPTRFGSSGAGFWQLAHGIDDRPVVPERGAKSTARNHV